MTSPISRACTAIKVLLAAVVVFFSAHGYAAVGVDWVLQNPTLTSESFNGVARNGDSRHVATTLVAVGSHGLIVSATSSAGPWTVRSSPSLTTENLNSVSWSPAPVGATADSSVGMFVAVGNKGVVLISADGIAWTKLASTGFTDPTQDFVSVFWTSAKFFVGGNSAAGPVVYSLNAMLLTAGSASADGSWKKYPGLGYGLKLRGIVGSLSSNVVALTDRNIQLSSANAAAPTWSLSSFPAGETSVQSMTFDGSKYVLSASKIYTATTIGSWVAQSAPLTSPNLNLTLNISQNLDKIIGVGANGAVWSYVPSSWTALPALPVADQTLQLRGAVDFGSDLVAVGDGGRIYRYASSAWTSVYSAGPIDNLSAIGVNGSALVALGNNVSLVSTNGSGWTRNAATINATSVIGMGGAGFLATGTGIWTSSDGAVWTPSSTTFTGRLNRVIPLEAGKAMAVGADTSTGLVASMIYLYDGTTWTKATLPAGLVKELRGAAFSTGGVTLAVGDGGQVLTSTNRTLWVKRAVVLAAGENFTDVLYSGTQFIASTSLGGTWTSPDGVLWTKRLAPAGTSLSRLVKTVVGSFGEVVGVGAAGTTARSYGGAYWYASTAGTAQSLTDAIWTGTQIIAVGSNGTILFSGGSIPPQPTVQFDVASTSVSESVGTVAITVKLSPAAAMPVTVAFSGSTSTKTSTTLATLGTTGAWDYSLPTPTMLTFAAGDTTKTITVKINEDNIDENDETATLTLGAITGDAVLGAGSTHVLTIVDDDTRPNMASAGQPQNQLVNVGDMLAIKATGGGAALPTGQWRKNGANFTTGALFASTLNGGVLPTVTYSCTFASALTTNAGAYTIFLTNPSGTYLSTSAAQIGVVDNSPGKSTVIAENGTLTLSVTAAGSGLSYRWQKGTGMPVLLDDDTTAAKLITGSKTAKLTIKKIAVGQADTYSCLVTQTTAPAATPGAVIGSPLGTQTKVGGTIVVYVVNAVPTVTPPSFLSAHDADRVVGELFDSVPAPTATNNPYKWSVTGLPPGVTASTTTGKLSGQAVKAGTYQVTYIATNVIGASAKVTATLNVATLPVGVGAVTADTFMALGKPNATLDLSLGSRLDLTVQPTSSFTGKLTRGTVATAFTGALLYTPPAVSGGTPFITGHAVLKQTGFPTVTLTFSIVPATSGSSPNTISVQVTDGAAVPTVTAFSGWRKSWVGTDPTTVQGLYTFALNPVNNTPPPSGGQGSNNTDITIPQGYTAASFTILSDGTLTLSGRMGDTTPFVSSGFVNATGATIGVPVYAGLYAANAGSVVGSMNLTPDSTSSYVKNTLSGTKVITWTKTPGGFGIYNALSLNLTVNAGSGRYTPPGAGKIVMDTQLNGTLNNLQVLFMYGGINHYDTTTQPPTPYRDPVLDTAMNPSVYCRVNSPAVVTLPGSVTNPANSANTTLSFDPKAADAQTGFFSGGFTLTDTITDPSSGAQTTLVRKSTFSGFIIGPPGVSVKKPADPAAMSGYGSFNLPAMSGSGIYSGAARLLRQF